MKQVTLRITFPEHLLGQPVLARVAREFDVLPNIRRAEVTERSGWVICELGGEDDDVDRAVQWLDDLGLEVDHVDRIDPAER